MPYYNVDARSLYSACLRYFEGHERQRAMAWVEAENIEAVWKVVQAWFELMETGKAGDRYPDPFWESKGLGRKRPLTHEVADKLIGEMDADFQIESARFPEGVGPEFARLPTHARVCFAQEIYDILKTESGVEAEVVRRIRNGERLPPDDVDW